MTLSAARLGAAIADSVVDPTGLTGAELATARAAWTKTATEIINEFVTFGVIMMANGGLDTGGDSLVTNTGTIS